MSHKREGTRPPARREDVIPLLPFYVVAVPGGVLEAIGLPIVERLFRRQSPGNQSGNLFVKIVVHKRKPWRPLKVHINRFRGIGVDLRHILASAELAWVFVSLIEIR